MVSMRDSICCQNVISKKDTFYYKDMGGHLSEFLRQVRLTGAQPNGNVFYALNNVPQDRIMKVEFFVPVKDEDMQVASGLRFHSYFSVEDMMSIRIKNDFNENTEKAYSVLLELMKAANLEQVTGPFHIINNVDGRRFVTLKIGYRAIKST